MAYCKKYNELPISWRNQVDALINKIKGKSWIADIDVEESDLKGYEFKVTICKYNTKRGWATIGYIRNDLFRGGIWRLTYKPRLAKGEKNTAGRTGSYPG